MSQPVLCDDRRLEDCDNPDKLAEWIVRDLNESTLHFYCQAHTDSWVRIVHGHKVSMEPASEWALLSRSEVIQYDERFTLRRHHGIRLTVDELLVEMDKVRQERLKSSIKARMIPQ